MPSASGSRSPWILLLAFCALALTATAVSATPVISAGNIPFSGISPGGVDMATGELILVMRPDLALRGPMPVVFGRYYASMLAREGLASGHMGPNWLGTYDWKLSVAGSNATLVTNRGQAIRFQQIAGGGWILVSPTYANFKLDQIAGGTWRFTNPTDRRLYFFDGVTWFLTQIVDERGNALQLSYNAVGLLNQVTDGLGRTLTFGYDFSNQLNMVSDGMRNVTYSYGVGGVLSGMVDAAGHGWNYSYQPGSSLPALLTSVLEPMGNTPVMHSYDPLGRVQFQTDALSHNASYTYDQANGNVYTDPRFNPWTYQHDAQQRLTGLLDPMGGPTSFQYDPQGRLSRAQRPMGDFTSYVYDPPSGYLSTIQLADGAPIGFTYSSHSVAGATLFDVATATYPDGSSDQYNRDAAGNLTDWRDQGNFHWLATYNARGQTLTLLNPIDGTTTWTYDPQGRLQSCRDNAGNTATYLYDTVFRLSEIDWPDRRNRRFTYNGIDEVTILSDEAGAPWNYAYDGNGRMTTATDPMTEPTGYGYDAMDRVISVTDALGHPEQILYDANGNVLTWTDRSFRATNYLYDSLNRLTSIINPIGAVMSQYGYDANSRLTSTQDALSHGATFQYDSRDHVIHVTDPVSSGFDYGYDSMGRLHTVNGPLGRSWTYNYDNRGLLTSFLNGTVQTGYVYTPLRELSQITDPNGHAWTRRYDPQGRLTSVADPLLRSSGYEYDEMSRPLRITRPDGSVATITYTVSRPIEIIGPFDGDASNTKVDYSYDPVGRPTVNTGQTFAYDSAGRMTASNGFTYSYDDAGRLTSQTFSFGKTESYSYDQRGWLSQVQDWLGGTTSFSYDAAGRLTGMTRPNGVNATYQYDAANRLVSKVEKQPGPTQTPISSIAITRDALGRLSSIDRRQPLMPGATLPANSSFDYDIASQLNGVGHDAYGRMTSDASRSFHWDGFSRLDHCIAGADSPRFAYDAFGNPQIQTQPSQTVQLAWGFGRGYPTNDDMAVSLPSRYRLHVRTPSGRLLYAVDGSSGARSFYHYDEAGNTTFLTNDSAHVVTEYEYDPFGGVKGLGQTADNPFTYRAGSGLMSLGPNGLWFGRAGIYDDRTVRVISGGATRSGAVNGYECNGYDSNGYDSNGYDSNGYDSNGYDSNGYDSNGVPDNGMPDNGMPDNGMPDNGVCVGFTGKSNPSFKGWGADVALNPQPFPPAPGDWVALNPQPFPPAPGDAVALNPQPFPPTPGGDVMLNPQPFPPTPQDFVDRFVTRNVSYGSAAKEVERNSRLKTVPVKSNDDFGKVKTDGNRVGNGSFGGGYGYRDNYGAVHQGFYDEWDFHHYMQVNHDMDQVEADPFDDSWQVTNVPKNPFHAGTDDRRRITDPNEGNLYRPSYPSAAPCVWCPR